MYAQLQIATLFHDLICMLFHIVMEGEQLQDLRLVFQEEVIPTGVPTSSHNQFLRQHQLFFLAVVGLFFVKAYRGDPSPLGSILGKHISQEVVVRCIADMKPRVFIGETHRHRLSVMLPTPGIEMPVLEHIIGHSPLVVYEYHPSTLSFATTFPLMTSKRSLNSSRVLAQRS